MSFFSTSSRPGLWERVAVLQSGLDRVLGKVRKFLCGSLGQLRMILPKKLEMDSGGTRALLLFGNDFGSSSAAS